MRGIEGDVAVNKYDFEKINILEYVCGEGSSNSVRCVRFHKCR